MSQFPREICMKITSRLMEESISQAKDSLPAVFSIGQYIEESISQAKDSLHAIFSIGQSMEQSVSQAKDSLPAVFSIGQSIEESISQAKDSHPAVFSIGQFMEEYFSQVLDSLPAEFSIGQSIIESISQAKDSLLAVFSIGQYIEESISQAKDCLPAVFSIGQSIEESFSQAKDSLLAVFSIVQSIEESFSQAKDSLPQYSPQVSPRGFHNRFQNWSRHTYDLPPIAGEYAIYGRFFAHHPSLSFVWQHALRITHSTKTALQTQMASTDKSHQLKVSFLICGPSIIHCTDKNACMNPNLMRLLRKTVRIRLETIVHTIKNVRFIHNVQLP